MPPLVPRRWRPMLPLVLLLGLTTACVGMPDTGPVHSADDAVNAPRAVGVERRAQPPQEGDSPQSIVNGFLQAMTAYPVNIEIVREFLATGEQDSWDPRRIITYQGPYSPTGAPGVRVRLEQAHWVDGRGVWRGARGTGSPTLKFQMTKENDEWRIASAPDAFIVPVDWFQDHYVQASVYFLDPTASILVPEPIFVPADQLPSALVQALLAGPGPALDDVVRSFVPPDLTPGLSVPVDNGGVATIALDGEAERLSPEAAKLLVYQFAWTLKQDPDITGFRISIGDQPVTLGTGTGTNQFSVDLGSEYEPTDVLASNQLFAVVNGSLQSGDANGTTPVAGPFGSFGGIETVAVSLKTELAAATYNGGRTVLLGSVVNDDQPIVPVVSDATKMLRPAWDFQKRLWLVDKARDGARVSVIDVNRGLTSTPLTIRGITGKQVRDFIVSRDGTRLVAVVRGRTSDELRISRIRHNNLGRVIGVTPSRSIAWSTGDAQRIRDIGWRSPTTVGVLHLLTKQVSLVESVAVDGSGTQDRLALTDVAEYLVSSPVANEPWFAVSRTQLIDPDDVAKDLVPALTSIQYVG